MGVSGKPTENQLGYLRLLADQAGVPLAPPTTSREASAMITNYKKQLGIKSTSAKPDDPPTEAQHTHLQALARQTGEALPEVKTVADASAAIHRLKKLPKTTVPVNHTKSVDESDVSVNYYSSSDENTQSDTSQSQLAARREERGTVRDELNDQYASARNINKNDDPEAYEATQQAIANTKARLDELDVELDPIPTQRTVADSTRRSELEESLLSEQDAGRRIKIAAELAAQRQRAQEPTQAIKEWLAAGSDTSDETLRQSRELEKKDKEHAEERGRQTIADDPDHYGYQTLEQLRASLRSDDQTPGETGGAAVAAQLTPHQEAGEILKENLAGFVRIVRKGVSVVAPHVGRGLLYVGREAAAGVSETARDAGKIATSGAGESGGQSKKSRRGKSGRSGHKRGARGTPSRGSWL